MTISIKDWKQLSVSEQKNAVKEVLTPHREEWMPMSVVDARRVGNAILLTRMV